MTKACALLLLLAGTASAQVAVHDTDGLYASVGDPANAGATLLLDPVTFTLDARGPLTLQPGMALVGQAGATIDGRALRPYGSGLVRIGQANAVSGLTILGPATVQTANVAPISVIDASVFDPLNPSGLAVEIRHNTLVGGNIGVSCRHAGAASAGLSSKAIIEGNTIANATGFPGSTAVLVQNSTGADGTAWTVILRENTLRASMRGLLEVSLSVTGAVNRVLSQGNHYLGDTIGLNVVGGRDNAANGNPGAAHDCAAYLVSNGDDIRDSSNAGVTIYGGLHTQAEDAESTGNLVRADFLHATFSGSMARAFSVLGALGNQGITPGDGNRVELLLRQTTTDGAPHSFQVADSSPAGGSDPVTLLGSDVSFEHTNFGLIAPDDDFFSGG